MLIKTRGSGDVEARPQNGRLAKEFKEKYPTNRKPTLFPESNVIEPQRHRDPQSLSVKPRITWIDADQHYIANNHRNTAVAEFDPAGLSP